MPPPGACDCHAHVFGPAAAFPFAQRRTYTPGDALVADVRRMMRTLGLERIVLVQPSPYGSDNRCLLAAMRELGPRARGVAVIGDDAQDRELESLHGAGVRGVRLNVASGPSDQRRPLGRAMESLARRIAGLGWHLQLFVAPAALVGVEATLERLPVPVVIDHMAMIPAPTFAQEAAFEALLRLLETGRCWVKLSGAYRLSGSDHVYDAVAPLARALVDARPDRLVWGSDWPHTPRHGDAPDPGNQPQPFRSIDTGRLLDLLADWASDPATRARILVDNPATLYGFGAR